MKKFLDPKVHGYLDFAYIGLLALAPTLFNFGGLPATLSYVLAAAVLGLVLVTRYPFGVIKAVPFTVHGGIELVASILAILAPFVLGFSEVESARNFFIGAGVLLLGVYLFTDYKAAVGDSVFSTTAGKDKAGVR